MSYAINKFPLTLSSLKETLKRHLPTFAISVTEQWFEGDISTVIDSQPSAIEKKDALRTSGRHATQLYTARGCYYLGGEFSFHVYRVIDNVTNNDTIWFAPVTEKNEQSLYFFSEHIIERLYNIFGVQKSYEEYREYMYKINNYTLQSM